MRITVNCWVFELLHIRIDMYAPPGFGETLYMWLFLFFFFSSDYSLLREVCRVCRYLLRICATIPTGLLVRDLCTESGG